MTAFGVSSYRDGHVNPALRRLGFGAKDRVVIIHADDIGMCEATVPAVVELLDFGLVSSCSVMVPCPWFPLAAEWSRLHPETDVGVHITLTSEWANYRWRPVSTLNPTSGLLDETGFMPRTTKQIQRQGKPEAIFKEACAQVAIAQRFGIRPSHLDSHMFALKGAFLSIYLQLILNLRLPALLDRKALKSREQRGTDTLEVEEQGIPVFDHVGSPPAGGPPEDRIAILKSLFSALPFGLSCVLLHPAHDTPELRAITPDWRYRVADWKAFRSNNLKKHLRSIGVQVITYKTLSGSMTV
ncbi:MAG TPA: polysaccharide deacetylase family protein [Candidatus Angelobacter sp.]|nr:polysaccharide deacetylase family protein [Candidatus Angelobacter sp.]